MIGGADIGEGAGPRSAIVADAAVFEVGGRQASGGKSCAEMSRMIEVIFGAPESSVDVNDQGIRWLALFFGRRQTQIEKLVGVRAIGEPRVGSRRWHGENVIGHRTLILVASVCREPIHNVELRWDRDSQRAAREPFR